MAGKKPVRAGEESPASGQMLIYHDGDRQLQVRLEGETLWMPQRLIADLYQTSVSNVNQHLASIYEDGELAPEATIKKYLIVQTEGSRQVRRTVDHYSLDAILADAGKVSHDLAQEHAHAQFERYEEKRLLEPQEPSDFDKLVEKTVKKLASGKGRKK